MSGAPRVVEALNAALHAVFAQDERVLLLGEDVLDPYGGAFKATRGLSTRFPGRVIATPLSEASLVSVATGLALCGDKPIVEFMFGDFIGLAFDSILNLASKSVSMYGRTLRLDLLIRCPVGANRGYGPTHSQSPQKHFVGIPNLQLFELSAFHECEALVRRALDLGMPAILFEDKTLYTRRVQGPGPLDELFRCDRLAEGCATEYAWLHAEDCRRPRCALIAPGGMAERCLAAARTLFLEHELECELLVPSRLHPFDLEPIRERLQAVEHVLVAEEAGPGGTWGAEVAERIHAEPWSRSRPRVVPVRSRDGVIPAAPHLERRVVVQAEDVAQAVLEATADA
jgi:pyruvate/2-oxoglutarate/acetoin dehydrogenase E1 component